MKEIERLDEYSRSCFQLLAGWFTFFVTVNWASLGWIVANTEKIGSDQKELVSIVSWVFAFQNLLGLAIVSYSGCFFISQSKKIKKYEIDELGSEKKIFPITIYLLTCVLMFLALVPIMMVWFRYPCYI